MIILRKLQILELAPNSIIKSDTTFRILKFPIIFVRGEDRLVWNRIAYQEDRVHNLQSILKEAIERTKNGTLKYAQNY